MPSASAKIEKNAPVEAIEPLQFCIQMLEKRMRNLEKRKTKLDNYRKDIQKGRELNEDQKMAVSKYDSVISILEFAGEMHKSISTLHTERMRHQKKHARKEHSEKVKQEINRLKEAFVFCHFLSCFQNEDVRSDFLNGENGAVQLTSEQLSQLDQLHKIMQYELPNDQADINTHFHDLATNHIFLIEGNSKEIVGTNFKTLKPLLLSIKECGYFTRSSENFENGTSTDDLPEGETVEKKENMNNLEEQHDASESPINDHLEMEDVKGHANPEETNSEAPPTAQNGLQEVLSSQNPFNFLQESQIDLGAPHMDPAVVAVHQMAPPPNVNFVMNPYSASPPLEGTSPPLVNGNEPHEMSGSSVPVSQVSGLPSGIPRSVPPVLTSVQHDFDPSHPIPTQTFTNQTFAVMQNMIMPQGYVPVTMHHGPLPPHIAPIAVVPASPVTTTPASVMPMHMPVTMQDGNPQIIGDSKPEVDETVPISESNVVDDPLSNDTVTEKVKEGNGYAQYRGGYRGRGRGRGNNGYFRGRNNYHNGRGGYQNHYYQDRNGYNGNYRRGNNRRGANGNNRGRGNYRTQPTQQQQSQQQQQQPQQQ
ncbi:caprin-1 [Trichonephila inaurata madagascariensis]|uniref:Caprin-1 n=1 Tax=Trichonephila inaurata madagascariensis TaxID=2747483 RepID=A0A8X6IFS9_9ARAC|nr:caprin-1 [Trichonephila inaurata madagascariensis]